MEVREASPTHFLIKIESFSLLDKHGIDKYETGEFEAGGYKWRLNIYPNGQRDSRGYVSVYLEIVDTSDLPPNWEVNAVFSICLFNQISCNYQYSLGRMRRFLAMKTEWGFPKFISNKGFIDPLNGYLIDDKCVFGAEVFVNRNTAVIECLSLKNVVVPNKREFKIENFSMLKDMWTSDEFTAGGHKWKLDVHPNGLGETTGHSLAIYLNHVASDECVSFKRVKACYTIRIKNQAFDRLHVKVTDSDWFFASKTTDNWGWPSFIKLATLKDPNRGFIVNDCCVIEVELFVQATSA